jgi:predicted O-methyltransferase YrrM
MLKSLEEIFEKKSIQINNQGDRIPLHSHTSKAQGVFLQKMFDIAKPTQSLEVGFAYGISAMFILEKHRELSSKIGSHIVIEPDTYWGTAATYNIEKEGLLKYLQIKEGYSDKILTQLFQGNFRIQYAYIDTTKLFDVVMQDFYFINKILDCGGIIILDDCGGTWPGIQRVARFVNTLPHYKILAVHGKIESTIKKKIAKIVLSFIINLLPFKKQIFPTLDFITDEQLGLDYSCIAFQKIDDDKRNWDWDKSF